MAELTRNLTSDEFRQYYFLKEELKDFCRSEGLKVSGSKGDLEKRIVHYLDTGERLAEPALKRSKSQSHEISLDASWGRISHVAKTKGHFLKVI